MTFRGQVKRMTGQVDVFTYLYEPFFSTPASILETMYLIKSIFIILGNNFHIILVYTGYSTHSSY